jgi:membrane-associated phospholipid phosphatase
MLLVVLITARPCLAQGDSLSSPPDERLSEQIAPPLVEDVGDTITWRRLMPNVIGDQAKIWLFPIDAARGHHLGPTLAVAGVTTALIVLDPLVARAFRGTHAFDNFNSLFSGQNTWLGTVAVLPAFYVAGLVTHDRYAQQTALLAFEAYLDANAVSLVLEDATSRLLPWQVPIHGDLSNTWFASSKNQSYWRGAGGFPSGHTISAFAIATVIADRYPNPSWHRWVAYGLASLVGFSRLTVQSHFPSDVLLGMAFGFVIPHYVVPRLTHSISSSSAP